jgi:hypothetical protein
MLGDIMLLCLRCEKFSQALDVLTKLEKNQNSIVGVPDIQALQLFTDMCISQNKIAEALVSFNTISLNTSHYTCLLSLITVVQFFLSVSLVSSPFIVSV